MLSAGATIYLKASGETLFRRLRVALGSRPLLAGKSDDELREAIRQACAERQRYYGRAKYMIDSDLLEDAFAEHDADSFLSASARIQKQLGRNEAISSQDQFDAVMLSKEPLKL